MGHFSRNIGAEFEGAVTNKLKVLQQQRIVARFQHNTPTWRKRGGYYQPTEASGADFSGMLYGGLHFSLEAKSTGTDKRTGKLQEFVRETRVPRVQYEDLEISANHGALSLLALQFRPDLEPWQTFVIPWSLVPWRERVKNHSVAMHEIDQRWRITGDTVLFEHLVFKVAGRWAVGTFSVAA